MSGSNKLEKLTITNLENVSHQIVAFVNPTNVAIDQTVKWTAKKAKSADIPAIEYTQADPAKLKLELLFDTYETKEDVYDVYISSLKAFCQVPKGTKGKKKHPPKVVVSWGDKKFLQFKGVITSLAVKYTYFLPNGTPTRATASLSLQAATGVEAKVYRARRSSSSSSSSGGSSGSSGGTTA